MRDCISCYNYNKPSCPFADLKHLDKIASRMYIVDCWCNKEDVEMCDMMCGDCEEDYDD